MFLTGQHERHEQSSHCAAAARGALHGWDRRHDHSTTRAGGHDQQRDVASLTQAADQIANLQKLLAAMQLEIDVLTEALDYARSIDCR